MLKETEGYPAIVLGMSPTGLQAVRELGSSGIKVFGVSRKQQPGAFSNYLEEVRYISPTDCNLINDFVKEVFSLKRLKVVLVPTSDDYIEYIVRNYKTLIPYCKISNGYGDGTVTTLLKKEEFARFCCVHHIKHPTTKKLENNIFHDVNGVNFPILLKPVSSVVGFSIFKGRKGVIIHRDEELSQYLAASKQSKMDIILQQLIHGPESDIFVTSGYKSASGQHYCQFSGRKIRQYPVYLGSACCVINERREDLEAVTRDIIDRLGYSGIYSAEFKLDRNESIFYIIEINARVGFWWKIASESGRKTAMCYYRDMIGDTEIEDSRAYSIPVVWKSGLKDILSFLIWSVRSRDGCDDQVTRLNFRGYKSIYSVWSWRDPLPFFADIMFSALKFIKKFDLGRK